MAQSKTSGKLGHLTVPRTELAVPDAVGKEDSFAGRTLYASVTMSFKASYMGLHKRPHEILQDQITSASHAPGYWVLALPAGLCENHNTDE